MSLQRFLRGGVYVLVLSAMACGGGNENPAAPTPVPPTPTPPAPPAVTLASFIIGAADTFMPGQNTAATLTLSAAAPTGGLVVNLSNSNPQAVIASSSGTIPEGATAVIIPILTSTVSSNLTVTITASAGGVSIPATLPLAAGPFLSFTSSSTDPVGQGRSRRFTTSDFGFSATATSALDQVTVSGNSRTGSGFWSLRLGAPTGLELRPGTYSNAAVSATATAPSLNFTAFGRSCSTPGGQFVITDIAFGQTSGGAGGPAPSLERLAATFVQTCGSTLLLGEVLAHSGP